MMKILRDRLNKLSSNRNQWMCAVFALYILFVFGFGLAYYLIFKHNRHAFAFNSDIVRSQSQIVGSDAHQRIEQLASELTLLRQLQHELSVTQVEPTLDTEFGGLLLTSTIKGHDANFTVIWPKARGRSLPPPPTNLRVTSREAYTESQILQNLYQPPTNLRVTSLDASRQITIVGEAHYGFPESLAEFRTLCDKWIADWEASKAQTQNVLDTLTTDLPDIWSYWDFLYFSAITQFTVGYGDILPNSTSVRLTVVFQTFIAMLFLAVIINFSSSSKAP